MNMEQIARKAQAAAIQLAAAGADAKNEALAAIARALENEKDAIAAANQADMERSKREALAAPLLKRLRFDSPKIEEACSGLQSLVALEDPVGTTLGATALDDNLTLYRVSRPIGVIGVIFESRPDALVQISCLCLKSGNAVLLKGGSEAAETNRVLAAIIQRAGREAGMPEGWLNLMETRSDVAAMLEMDAYIDLIIPRGSNEFVRHIMDNTRIPVLGHADGICHVYIDREADLGMARRIAVDSKTQYVAVCNAAETLLVHTGIAEKLLPVLKSDLEARDVEIRGCERTAAIIAVAAATEEDWRTEYLDLVVSIRVVDNLAAGIDHINRYGSGHTDVIVTADRERARHFMDHVDTADVFVNCSSRFCDGFRFGLGAEVGISTNKIHARGPVGLEGLLIYQWRLVGNGQIVADYSGPDGRSFKHQRLDKDFEI